MRGPAAAACGRHASPRKSAWTAALVHAGRAPVAGAAGGGGQEGPALRALPRTPEEPGTPVRPTAAAGPGARAGSRLGPLIRRGRNCCREVGVRHGLHLRHGLRTPSLIMGLGARLCSIGQRRRRPPGRAPAASEAGPPVPWHRPTASRAAHEAGRRITGRHPVLHAVPRVPPRSSQCARVRGAAAIRQRGPAPALSGPAAQAAAQYPPFSFNVVERRRRRPGGPRHPCVATSPSLIGCLRRGGRPTPSHPRAAANVGPAPPDAWRGAIDASAVGCQGREFREGEETLDFT